MMTLGKMARLIQEQIDDYGPDALLQIAQGPNKEGKDFDHIDMAPEQGTVLIGYEYNPKSAYPQTSDTWD